MFEALNISSTEEALKINRLNLITRLYQNELTKEIMTESFRNGVGLMVKHELEMLVEAEIDESFGEFMSAIAEKVEIYRIIQKSNKKKSSCDKVAKLRVIFNSKNRTNIAEKIFDIARFDAA